MGFYRTDRTIENKVILEIKVIASMITKAMQDQVYYYIKGTNINLPFWQI